MENEKLIAFMNLKGISRNQLSASSNIPPTTLNRIINGKIQKVKMVQMEAIAKALGTTIYSIFDVSLDVSISGVIKPEEAGATIEKLLNPDESLLLFFYQNSFQDGKAAIMKRAKSEYYQTQSSILNKDEILFRQSEKSDDKFSQLTLEL